MRTGLTIGLALGSAVVTAATVPWANGLYEGDAWFRGDVAREDAFARGVEASLDLSGDAFATGSPKFDGEWWFGTFFSASIGFGHLALRHPEHRDVHLQQMERALDRLKEPAVAAFDTHAWGISPWDELDGEGDHAAFYGYTGFAFALHRKIAPGTPYDTTEQALIDTLARRFRDRPILETYPGERYPIDNAAGIGALALHGGHAGAVSRWRDTVRTHLLVDGVLVQAVGANLGVRDGPRGSGTGLAAYFLGWADPELARELYGGMRRGLYGGVLGFGAMREYPRGTRGDGDIDSGPVILGYSVSGTGFALASARREGDRAAFDALYATAHTFGAPTCTGWGDARVCNWATGGPLGDALMFAMLTSPRPDEMAP